MITSIQPKLHLQTGAPRVARTSQTESAPADRAELSGAQESSEVKRVTRPSAGFINGLKKTAAVAALAATLGCVATPAMADCYGNYGYSRPSTVAVQVDPYNGVTISQNQYNRYGGSDHVAVTIGRNGVRLEAGHDYTPPVVVMPNPYPVYPAYPQPQIIVVPAPRPMPLPGHRHYAPQVMPFPAPHHHHHHHNGGWNR